MCDLQCGRKVLGIDIDENTLSLIEAPYQDQAPDIEIARMCGIHPVAVMFERRPRGVERLRRPAKVTRGERDLGFRDDAPRASHRLSRTEGAGSASHESSRADEISELRHGDASKSERRRVIAKGDAVQCAEWIAARERPRRGRDQ
jgi:hypothetical protein